MHAIFEFIGNIFAVPFGFVLSFFYNLTGSYILSIILLTVLVKLCLLPFSLKQQKSLIVKARINLKKDEIKKRYANDEQKAIKATQALYKNEQTGKQGMGCLTFIIQLCVMIGLFNIIYVPLTSVLRFSTQTIETMKNILQPLVSSIADDSNMLQIELLKEAHNYKDALIEGGALTQESFNELSLFHDKFKFMGLDLSLTPEFTQLNALWLIPILVLTIGLCSGIYSYIRGRKHDPYKGKYTAIDAIVFITPMISFLFTFMFPAGVGLYWAISNLLSFIQTIILNIIYNPHKVTLSDEEKESLFVDSLNSTTETQNSEI